MSSSTLSDPSPTDHFLNSHASLVLTYESSLFDLVFFCGKKWLVTCRVKLKIFNRKSCFYHFNLWVLLQVSKKPGFSYNMKNVGGTICKFTKSCVQFAREKLTLVTSPCFLTIMTSFYLKLGSPYMKIFFQTESVST